LGAFADLCLNCLAFIVSKPCENVEEIVKENHHTDLKTAYLESHFTTLTAQVTHKPLWSMTKIVYYTRLGDLQCFYHGSIHQIKFSGLNSCIGVQG